MTPWVEDAFCCNERPERVGENHDVLKIGGTYSEQSNC